MWVVYTISITSTPCHHTHHSDGVGAAGAGSHSVQIFDSNVDNTMTLCCLRVPVDVFRIIHSICVIQAGGMIFNTCR